MKEPIRMRETDQLPAALRDAFGALGRDAPSAETVLRVQRALEALPAVTPAAAAVGGFGASKLLVLVTLIAGAVTTTYVVRSRQVPQRADLAERAVQATPAPESLAPSAHGSAARTPVQATPALEPQAAEQVAPSAAPAHAGMPERAPGRVSGSAPARLPARASNAGRAPSAELSSEWAQSLVAPAASRPTPAASARPGAVAAVASPQPAASEEQTPTAQQAAPTPDPGVAAVQASEAQKLAHCKRLAAHDPAQALLQLEALAREVPHGTFVQERELLEIRLHQRLGHAARAAELTRRFLESHPNSVYRRALAP
ncbi:MAG TPA: hypothetical protein VFZ61_21050 [Polyangiales bacterium]